MERRNLLAALAGVGGAGALGAGGWYALGRGTESGIDDVTVQTIDARGSTAGTLTVPLAGQVTVLDVFSIGCAPCKTELGRLRAVQDRLPGNARLVSVTNDAIGGTLTRDDLRQWWRDNDGNWAVGIDANGDLMRELGVTGLPTLAVLDADGRVAWKHAGLVAKQDLLNRVAQASQR
ncbi:MAG: TlpA family protein disulfide reductase [Haloarculaceae archaeon]